MMSKHAIVNRVTHQDKTLGGMITCSQHSKCFHCVVIPIGLFGEILDPLNVAGDFKERDVVFKETEERGS